MTIQSTAKIASCWDLCDPTIWYHEQEGILYTGFGGWKSDLTLNATVDGGDRSMCTFRPNGAGSGAWENLDNSAELGSIGEPSQTLNAFSPDTAFAVGGYNVDNGGGLPTAEMFQFDMALKTITNISAVGYEFDEGAVAVGRMEYVPSFGPQGIFVAMGGTYDPNSNESMVSFETVSVFDPTAQKWWNQTTTGSPPAGRIDFCTAGVNSTSATYEM